MIPAELSILLHRALAARVHGLGDLMLEPDWAMDPERLHRVRVASRRVRAALGWVDSGLYPAYKRQSRRLETLTEALGVPRELDVLAELLESAGHRLSGTSAWAALEHALELLERRRAKARGRMQRRLKELDPTAFAKLLQVPSLPNPFQPADARCAAWERVAPELEAIVAVLTGQEIREETEPLHALRVRVKQLRYRLEILAEVFQADFDSALQTLHRLQSALGDHHDHAVLEAFLWGLHGGLVARRRAVLAEGILELLGLVAEARRDHFEGFRRQAGEMDPAAFCGALQVALGIGS